MMRNRGRARRRWRVFYLIEERTWREWHQTIGSVTHHIDNRGVLSRLTTCCSRISCRCTKCIVRCVWGVYQTTFSSSTYMLINLGVWLCPCTAGIICCFAALNYPPEFNIKNRAGENIGCITGDIDRQTQKHHKHDNGNHSKPTVMHFRGMTLEQRRLGLVAALHYMATTWRGDM